MVELADRNAALRILVVFRVVHEGLVFRADKLTVLQRILDVEDFFFARDFVRAGFREMRELFAVDASETERELRF